MSDIWNIILSTRTLENYRAKDMCKLRKSAARHKSLVTSHSFHLTEGNMTIAKLSVNHST